MNPAVNNQETRRKFLKTSTGVAAGVAVGFTARTFGAEETKGAAKEPAALAALRKTAKRRRRRLIYNNDGCDVMEAGAGTLEGFLSKRCRPILGTQVDSMFYCTGATTMFTHLAKVGETYGEFVPDGSEAMAIHARDNIRALKEAGHDTLASVVKFCHENKLEIFFTHRINDIHDTFLDWELSRWKREYPEYLLGTRQESAKAGGGNSPKHWWSAFDFERPEVLDYLCRIEEDVCSRYDIDGVEIDYFRSPMFFRPNLEFKPATTAQVEILTGFQRRLREVAYRAGTKRGRPILMATRVPATPAACRHVGIDVARWLKEGLTDLLTVGGGYVPFTEPLGEIIRLAHEQGVPVYPTISASGMRGPEGRYSKVEAWRGAAANMWWAGADGIYAFNVFPSGPEPRFMDIGSPKTLAGRDKLFVVDPVRILEGDLVQGIEQRQALPVTIPTDGKAAVARLIIGDDIPAAGKKGRLQGADLRIHLSDPKVIEAVEVRLNGLVLKPTQRDAKGGWLTFQPKADQYRFGRNDLSFRAVNASVDAKSLADVTHVEVHVKYQ